MYAIRSYYALKASGIDLAAVSRSLGWPALGGRLGAELPDIRFADEEISSGGEATLQIFEGAVRLRNMRVRQPLSSYPTFHADVDFSGINRITSYNVCYTKLLRKKEIGGH